MPFNTNDSSFSPYRGPIIKEESQPDGIKQLAAANLYVLSGGHDFSPRFSTDFNPQNIDLASTISLPPAVPMDIDVDVKLESQEVKIKQEFKTAQIVFPANNSLFLTLLQTTFKLDCTLLAIIWKIQELSCYQNLVLTHNAKSCLSFLWNSSTAS